MDPDIHREQRRRRAASRPGGHMRKSLSVALAALAVACSSDSKQKPLAYGAAQPPTPNEQSAVQSASFTLEGALAAPDPTTQPDAGGVGLADQLVNDLGGGAVNVKASRTSPKYAQAVARMAFDTTGMDPTCVSSAEANGTITWTWGASKPCHVVFTDAATGETMTVDIMGTLSWNASAGRTTWDIREPMSMRMVDASTGDQMSVDATAAFSGTTTNDRTALRFTADTGSSVAVHATIRDGQTGQTQAFDVGLSNSLEADLGYVLDPAFCIASGKMTVEQRWTKLPAGATAADFPNQGWQFTWAGCGAFTVAHGS
jgi:hypothetical protein